MDSRDAGRITGDSMDKLVRADEEIIRSLCSIPRVKPGLRFRMKVAVESRLAGTALEAVFDGRTRRGSRREIRPRVSYAGVIRGVGYGAVAVFVALMLFAGLTAVAGGSKPGDTLYGLKRIRENISLALSGSTAEKAGKQLALAQERLSELDRLAGEKETDPADVKYLADEFNKSNDFVRSAIASNAGGDAVKLQSALMTVQTEKENIVRKIAAANPASLALAASGAEVAVSDASGARTLGAGSADVRGKADTDGVFRFDYQPASGKGSDLDVTVALDGWTMAAPLSTASDTGNATVKVTPQVAALPVGASQRFTLEAADGSLGGSRLVLEDRSGTSLINGQQGSVEIASDGTGTYCFTVTKTGADVSRITAEMPGLARSNLEDVLVLGAVVRPDGGVSSGAVSATVTSHAGNGSTVALQNGSLKVSSGDAAAGVIAGSVSTNGAFAGAPAVIDPGVESALARPGCSVNVEGPVLVENSGSRAGYEVDYRITEGGSTVTKEYRVSLGSTDKTAAVSCRTTIENGHSASRSLVEEAVTGAGVRGSFPGLKIAGETVEPPAEGSLQVGFETAKPYATFEYAGKTAVFAYPSGVPNYWLAGARELWVKLPVQGAMSGASIRSSSLIGFCDGREIDQAVEGSSYIEPGSEPAVQKSAGDVVEAFSIESNPLVESVESGRRRIELDIRKLYEDASSYFK